MINRGVCLLALQLSQAMLRSNCKELRLQLRRVPLQSRYSLVQQRLWSAPFSYSEIAIHPNEIVSGIDQEFFTVFANVVHLRVVIRDVANANDRNSRVALNECRRRKSKPGLNTA